MMGRNRTDLLLLLSVPNTESLRWALSFHGRSFIEGVRLLAT